VSPLLLDVSYDVRYALRVLLKSPGFTAIIIATLALGIGANTALFSVVNGVLLNPLPYPSSARLVAIYQKDPGMDQAPVSYLNFLDWQRASQSFSSMAIYHHEDYNLTGSAQAERVNGLMVSADFFATLGIHPSLGRDFRSEDDRIGEAPIAMLSDGFWHRRFGASPGIFLALGLTRLMSSQLFGITPHDPLTFAGVALVLLLVALGACYFPARRAMGVDPMVALRHE
jgi:hypothetical protein